MYNRKTVTTQQSFANKSGVQIETICKSVIRHK